MRLYDRSRVYGFVIPIAVAAAGITGVAATVVSAVASIALGIALSYAAKALTPKQKKQAGGVRVGLQIATDAERDVILGHAATGGQLVYWHTYGSSNKYLQLVIALASHPIDGVSEIRVNGEVVTWNPTTGAVTEYPGMTIKVYDGTQTTADANLVANSGGRWASTAIGYGVAYAVCSMEYKAETYPKGIPEFLFRVRGAKLYDPRTGTTAYTDNPAVITYNLIRGVSYNGLHLVGLRAPVEAIRAADAIAAANACDELIPLVAGGSEKRYRCGMVVDCGVSNREAIRGALAAMGGKLIHAGGIYRIQAGVAQTAIAHITDDDLIATEALTTSPRQPRSEMVNAVLGSFSDPALGFKLRPLPARTSSADETQDGGIRLPITVEMPTVFSPTQGQRLMEIERRRARRMGTATMVVRARWSVLEAGDWITFTSARRDYVAKSFEIVATSKRPDQQIEFTLRENDAGFDDWTPVTDELSDTAITDLPPAMPALVGITPTSLAAITVVGAGGTSRPGLQVQWTPPADPTIIEITLEYRKVGDTTALERRIMQAELGAYTWLDGVQGGVQYECRLVPVTQPRRAVEWSSWVAAPAAAGDQVVAQAVTATTAASVPPDTVTLDMLDPEAEFAAKFALLSADEDGSLAQAIRNVKDDVQVLGASLLTHRIDLAETTATVRTEQMQRVTGDEAFASYKVTTDAALADKAAASAVSLLESRVTSVEGVNTAQASAITSLETDVDGNTSSITQILSDVGGNKRFSIVFDSNGQMTGFMSLDGTTQGTELILGVSAIKVFDPLVNGGTPVPFLKVIDISGTKHMILDGTFMARAIEAGEINAPSGSIGVLTSGQINGGPNGKLIIDIDVGRIRGTA